jgi:hypothetical protein
VTSPDPNSRALRGAISGAVRRGDPDLEAELRHELKLRNVEAAILRVLDGTRLTPLEVRRLRLVVEAQALPRSKPAEPAEDARVAV